MKRNHKTRAEGKAPSQNAAKHGLRSSIPLIQGESAEDLAELREGLMADYRPVGRLELELVERAVSCFWRLRRISSLEADVLDELARLAERSNLIETACKLDQAGQGFDDRQWTETPEKAVNGKLYKQVEEQRLANLLESLDRSVGRGLVCGRAEPALTLLRRYESSLDRCLASALNQLDRIQSARRREEKDRRESEAQPRLVLESTAASEAVPPAPEADAGLTPTPEPEVVPDSEPLGAPRQPASAPYRLPHAADAPAAEEREARAMAQIRSILESPANAARLQEVFRDAQAALQRR